MRDNSQNEIIYTKVNSNRLIIAPPGYGKTETMAKRISYLIRNKLILSGKHILGITFTNAAAFEMKRKVFQKIRMEQRSFLKILNFHSFCYEIMSNFSYKMKIDSNFDIISELESEKLLLKLIEAKLKKLDPNSNFSERELRNQLNSFILWKSQNILNNKGTFSTKDTEIYSDIYNNYSNLLLSKNKMDFDLLLVKTLELFNSHPKILQFLRRKIEYIIIDEFQDTNGLQYSIAKILIQGKSTPDNKNPKFIPFMCFGDPFQSIYQFQGASPKNLDCLREDFPEIELKYLEINHRNKSPLIKSLNNLVRIKSSSEKIQTQVEKYECFIAENIDNEAEFIVKEIQNLINKEIPLHEICLVSPRYSRLKNVDLLLNQEKINFINFEKFRNKYIEKDYSFLFNDLQDLINSKSLKGNLVKRFKKSCSEAKKDWKNDVILIEIFNYFSDFQRFFYDKDMPFWKKIKLILNDIRLDINWNQVIREKIQNKIFLSSIHQVKGLEFSYVFIIGFEGGIIPNFSNKCRKCDIIKLDLNEDINLLYVALSRMKKGCTLTIRNENEWGYRKYASCAFKLFLPIINFYEIETNEHLQWKSVKCNKIEYQYVD
jgi:superfamily I DNA/RNA helicase